MTAIYTDHSLARTTIATTPVRVLDSIRELRAYLTRLAMDHWTGPEGRHWSIAQAPPGTLVPLYARNRHTGDTITIE